MIDIFVELLLLLILWFPHKDRSEIQILFYLLLSSLSLTFPILLIPTLLPHFFPPTGSHPSFHFLTPSSSHFFFSFLLSSHLPLSPFLSFSFTFHSLLIHLPFSSPIPSIPFSFTFHSLLLRRNRFRTDSVVDSGRNVRREICCDCNEHGMYC